MWLLEDAYVRIISSLNSWTVDWEKPFVMPSCFTQERAGAGLQRMSSGKLMA